MKKKIIIYSNFNTPNYIKSPFLEAASKKINLKSWIDGRMDIFFEYTLQGFIGQTNQDFTAIYNYTDESENLVLNSIKERGGLPYNVLFVPRSKYQETVDKLIEGYDQLYLTKLDSDDIYIKTFVETLHNLEPKDNTEVVICSYGYMHNTLTGEMAKIWHISASFHAYIYKFSKETARYDSLDLSPLEFLDKSHFAALNYRHEYIPGYNFIWNIHENNSSTKFGVYDTDVLKTIEMIDSEEAIEKIIDKFI